MKTNKKLASMIQPNTKIYIWIIAILNILIFAYNISLGIVGFFVLIYLVIFNWISNNKRKQRWQDYIESLSSDIDSAARYAILNLPIPLTLVDFDGKISWYNSKFIDLAEEEDLLDVSIKKLFPKLDIYDLMNSEQDIEIKVGDKIYRLLHNIVKFDEMSTSERFIIMIYWIDITAEKEIKVRYNDERLNVALIRVDNFNDVMKATKENDKPIVRSEIERIINLWAIRMSGVVKKYQKDKYIVIYANKYLNNLKAKRFTILDEIKEIKKGNDIPVTISIGIGSNGETYTQLEKEANAALELALGRGGNQVALKENDKFEFYGGKSKAVSKRNKVKARIIAHGMRPLIDEARKVFVMGHRYPDMDCFGAGIGIYRAALNRGKDVYIVLNEVTKSIDNIYENFKDDEDYHFLNSEEALEIANDEDLLIVVDTHRPSFVECPELLDVIDHKVLIDHHRRGTEFIEDAALAYLETYASSASELVTEILQYIEDKIVIDAKEAEALLAGIFVDTKNFAFNTGVKTFEAASFLRRYNADTTKVRQLFQDDLETFVSKSKIVSNVDLLKEEIAISILENPVDNAQLIVAQGADELLNIRGVETSFVFGKRTGDEKIFLSARSLGKINVQIILEKIGGGGHFTMAGAQFEDISFDEAKEQLIKAINTYLEEGDK